MATSATSVRESAADVCVTDFLAQRRAVPHLFDLAPEHDPAAFASDDGHAPGASVFTLVRTTGGRDSDVRLLVDDGQRHEALARALAQNLRCDVYLTPEGSHIRYLRESSPVAGDSYEAVAIDRSTGEPVPWLVARPGDLPADVPTWFTTVRGRLRPNHGVVAVPLPNGIAFATRATFRDTTSLAATMRDAPGRVTTVAVNADMGRFEISRFDDAGSLLGGVEFATLVAASLDVIHPDVQLALTWPADSAACAALDVELMRLADALNRTIWVPQAQGAAFVLAGCGEFAAVDEVGSPSTWHAYPSRLATQWRPRYGTDLDGRLVPPGQTVATAFPGVRFVSVPEQQLERLRPWYESVAPSAGLFALDLAVLADGRLGVLIGHSTPLAAGPRELRELLRAAGWSGEDLLLLTQPPQRYWYAAIGHLCSLANQLKVDVWFAALGADVWATDDGTLAAAAPEGRTRAWHVVRFGQAPTIDDDAAPDIATPAALTTAARPANRARSSIDLAYDAPTLVFSPIVADPGGDALEPVSPSPVSPAFAAPPLTAAPPAPSPLAAAEPTMAMPTVVPSATAAQVEPTSARDHAIAWLPHKPSLNRRAIDLYLWTPDPSDRTEAWELPSADLFLLAGQDPLRLAERRLDGCLLRLSAPEQTAVDLLEHGDDAPSAVRQRLREAGATHLLPLAWMSDLHVTARFDLDGRGGITARWDVDAAALAIRFEGARHGVAGLPDDVVCWPEKGQRAGLSSYLMLRDDTALDHIVGHGYVCLSRRKPALAEGHTLIEVKVHKRKAIDVPATLRRLDGLPVVGRVHDFVGLDLLLPEVDLAHAVISKVWRYGSNGRPVVDKPSPAGASATPLSSIMTMTSVGAGHPAG